MHLFFNLYSEDVTSEALEDAEKVIIINEKVVNYFGYADDSLHFDSWQHGKSTNDI